MGVIFPNSSVRVIGGIDFLRFARGGASFDPNSIAGLKLWLKTDAGAYKDAGVALASNNDTVQQWNDQSANVFNVSQATAGNRPTFQTGIKNGLPGIQFNGSTNALFKLAGLFGSGDFCYFVVFRETAANARPFIQGAVGGGRSGFNVDGTPKLVGAVDGGVTIFTGITTLVNGTTYLAELLYINANNPKSTLYLNGGVEATQNNAADYASDRVFVGSNPQSSAWLTGHVFEILAYNATLTVNNQTSIRSYLNSRWAIY